MRVTILGGGDGIPADDEARAVWRKVTGFADDRIVGLGMADNFWQMGETGPCGPNSEIYFYHGDNPDPSKLTDEPSPDGTGWVELWNLVFMQFERSLENGAAKLTPLPKPCIDTRSGLERTYRDLPGNVAIYITQLVSSLGHKVPPP